MLRTKRSILCQNKYGMQTMEENKGEDKRLGIAELFRTVEEHPEPIDAVVSGIKIYSFRQAFRIQTPQERLF